MDKHQAVRRKRKVEAIDLFCGIGGLSYGLKKAGINIRAGVDLDGSCQYAYETNNRATFIEADISKYDFGELNKFYSQGSHKILVGCAPCQPFSSHSFKLKIEESNDNRWNLIRYFTEAVRTLNPVIVSMENVKGLVKTEIFKDFLQDLTELGFLVDYRVVSCPDYGIPQYRHRLVVLGSRLGKIVVPDATHKKEEYLTVEDAIKDLPRLKAGETNKTDCMHQSRNLKEINRKRIKQSKPHGTWRDWDKKLLPNCYLKESGQTYSSVYGRMSWDKPSPTITTQFFSYGTGRFGHPEQDRALSLREGSILQTFPRNYDFGRTLPFEILGRQIGNAVPPKLGEVIGKTIVRSLGIRNG